MRKQAENHGVSVAKIALVKAAMQQRSWWPPANRLPIGGQAELAAELGLTPRAVKAAAVALRKQEWKRTFAQARRKEKRGE